MKKIVALVLSLVMALALCTTAFAADKVQIYSKDTEGRFTVEDVEATVVAAKAANPAKYEEGNIAYLDGGNGYYFIEDAKGNYAYQKDGKTITLKAVKADDAYGVIFYDVEAKKVAKDYTWDCETGVHGAGYLYTWNGVQYLAIEADDEDVEFYVLADGKIIGVEDTEMIKPGSHVLTKTGTTSNKQVNTYKCVVCGKTFFGTKDPAVAAVEDENYIAYYGMAVIDATYGYVTAPEFTKFVEDDLYIWAADGSAAADKGTSSPKTFDAGIALYVGMSLMSVAGSAVVIGKKKEF